jgi:NAD+ diphosphatase
VSILDWKHCPRCGAALEAVARADDAHVRCPRCGFVQYDNPLPTTVALVLRGDRLLLVQRADHPRKGYWDTVGGFLNAGETAEECVTREVVEELGCEIACMTPLGTFASVYGDTGRATVGVAFVCELSPDASIHLSKESTAAEWFDLDNVPELAFQDGHDAVEALRRTRRPSLPAHDT